jgi:DNA-binding CsgD family transcriptional regulator
MTDPLGRGRRAFASQAWADARELLAAADSSDPSGGPGALDTDDVERLAVATYLAGDQAAAVDLWTRAHHEWLERSDVGRAVRCGFWLSFALVNAGELSRGGGWADRAQRLLDDHGLGGPDHGYLRYCRALRTLFEGDAGSARHEFAEAVATGSRHGDRELVALAQVGLGWCLLSAGDVTDALVMFDESMVAVTNREVSPIVVGDLCCTVIFACQQVLDVRRVEEWTAALSAWCATQPQLVLYRGQCLIHRAELMLLHGVWDEAVDEAQRACSRLARPTPQPALGAARYVRGELHRLRGEHDAAEAAYREANEWGHQPQPGLALLRLAQGRTEVAAAMIRRVLGEAHESIGRVPLLAACVDIALVAGDLGGARDAAGELQSFAAAWRSPLLAAQAAHASGRVVLAEGDALAAVAALRRSWECWRTLDAPYEGARSRVDLGRACRALGDEDGARLELEAARATFVQLGAAPDVACVDDLAGPVVPPLARPVSASTSASAPSGSATPALTPRELEVLALVATGRTNRVIAGDLAISEKTVASHVSSILSKLGLTSRSAATAYAYEHDLATRAGSTG